jgi:hypothetical protein
MVKKLAQVGSSLALVIDKPILELFKIDKETPLEILPDGDGFKIRIIRDQEREKRLQDAIADGDQRFSKMFRKLAQS